MSSTTPYATPPAEWSPSDLFPPGALSLSGEPAPAQPAPAAVASPSTFPAPQPAASTEPVEIAAATRKTKLPNYEPVETLPPKAAEGSAERRASIAVSDKSGVGKKNELPPAVTTSAQEDLDRAIRRAELEAQLGDEHLHRTEETLENVRRKAEKERREIVVSAERGGESMFFPPSAPKLLSEPTPGAERRDPMDRGAPALSAGEERMPDAELSGGAGTAGTAPFKAAEGSRERRASIKVSKGSGGKKEPGVAPTEKLDAEISVDLAIRRAKEDALRGEEALKRTEASLTEAQRLAAGSRRGSGADDVHNRRLSTSMMPGGGVPPF
ncbi:hypothetical protein DFJ74DRAFT_713254 [Hyaloraphidium curvatum]|nr:hypothetical protein DFJ74DRAFT_713254 [Hyaloraphidium curvatum]